MNSHTSIGKSDQVEEYLPLPEPEQIQLFDASVPCSSQFGGSNSMVPAVWAGNDDSTSGWNPLASAYSDGPMSISVSHWGQPTYLIDPDEQVFQSHTGYDPLLLGIGSRTSSTLSPLSSHGSIASANSFGSHHDTRSTPCSNNPCLDVEILAANNDSRVQNSENRTGQVPIDLDGATAQTAKTRNRGTKNHSYCETCGVDFSRTADRYRHEKSHQKGHAVYACGHCKFGSKHDSPTPSREFTQIRKDKVVDHIKSRHKLEVCSASVCSKGTCSVLDQRYGYVFNSAESLQEHHRTVHDESDESHLSTEGGKVENASGKMTDKGPCSQGIEIAAGQQYSGDKRTFDAASYSAAKKQKLGPVMYKSNMPDLPMSIEGFSMAPSPSLIGKGQSQIVHSAVADSGGNITLDVPNVQPAEFLVIAKQEDVIQAESTLERATDSSLCRRSTTSNNAATKGMIVYLRHNSLIRLQGPADLVYLATKTVKTALLHIQQGSDRSSDGLTSNTNNCYRPSHTSKVRPDSSNAESRVFPVQAEQDHDQIETWKKHILPELPKILRRFLGPDYQAALVRQGVSESEAQVLIRIQSPDHHPKTRRKIESQIAGLCMAENKEPIKTKFSKGGLLLLSGTPSIKHNDSENEDEGDDEIPHHRRFWKYVGMGASLGLACSTEVSGTLGGYILVDGMLKVLTTEHFIQKAIDNKNGAAANDNNAACEIISPSLFDQEDIRRSLKSNIMGTMVEIADWADQLEEDAISVHQLCPRDNELQQYEQEIRDWYIKLLEWDRDNSQNREHFSCGRLTNICGRHEVQVPYEGSTVSRKMDWAMFEVNSSRKGENRHRHARNVNNSDPQWKREGQFPKGAGDHCTVTASPKAGAHVHYVGAWTGFQSATVSPPPTLNCRGGHATWEWSLVIQGEPNRSHEGDSGAWIIQDTDNALVGMLWGEQDSLLHFTPIGDIFANIKEDMSGAEVCLPQAYPPPGSASIVDDKLKHIARVQQQRAHPKKSRPPFLRPILRKLSLNILPTIGSLPATKEPLSLAAEGLALQKAQDNGHASHNSIDDRCPSPVPSLVSMRTEKSSSSSDCQTPGMEPEALVKHSNPKDNKHSLEFIMGSFTLGSDRDDHLITQQAEGYQPAITIV